MSISSPLGAGAAAVALIALLAGCASTEDKAATEYKPARELRTGSNIPVRDSGAAASAEERERTADQIRAMQRVGSPGKSGN